MSILHPMIALVALATTGIPQQWIDRVARPAVAGLYTKGGPKGAPVGVRGRNLVMWSSGAWMPFATLPTSAWSVGEIAYDRARSTMVMSLGSAIGNQTAEWSEAGWNVTGVTAPSARMCYDPALGGVICFTDNLAGGTTQDYLWTGTAWNPLAANVRPIAVGNQLAADHARSRLVALTELSTGVGGQTFEWDGLAWTSIASPTNPGARDNASMCFDETTSRVTLFGGSTPTLMNDTWQWDGANWAQIAATTPVPMAAQARLGMDLRRGSLALFGTPSSTADCVWTPAGWQVFAETPIRTSSFQIVNDPLTNLVVHHGESSTSTWDGVNWNVGVAAGGPSRRTAMMAYDVTSGDVVVFGGGRISVFPVMIQTFGDTWTFDGGSWTQQSPPVSPAPRRNHALLTHASGAVMFGGLDTNGAPLGDTWAYSNGAWTQLTFGSSPPPGACFGSNGTLGRDPFVVASGELWQFTGTWTLVTNQLPPVNSPTVAITPAGNPMLVSTSNSSEASYELINGVWTTRGPVSAYVYSFVFDPQRGNLCGFAANEMRVLTASPATVASIGQGCGTPAPKLYAEQLPRTGSPEFRVNARDTVGAVAFLASFTGGTTPLGGGCSAYLSNFLALGVDLANLCGVASQQIPVPMNPALVGQSFRVQAVTPQAGAPFSGLALSDAVVATLGL